MSKPDEINPRPRRDPGPRTRNSGSGRFVKTTEGAERDAEAAKLRSTGMAYADIARTLGYADASGAHLACSRAMRAIAEPARDLRAIELARLDLILREAWAVMVAEHITVSQGRVVNHPDTGLPLKDHGPVLAAIDRILKIAERRARLLGLDAPTKIEAITVDQIESAINQLAEELGVNDRQAIGS